MNRLVAFAFRKPLAFSMLASFVLMLLTYFFLGFYYEEGTDPVMIATIAPIFKSEANNIVNNFGFHFITSHIYAFFYNLNASVPWYDLFMLLMMFAMSTNLFLLWVSLSRRMRWEQRPLLFLFGIVAMAFLWVDHIALVQITRIAMLLSSTSILLIIDIYFFDQQKRQKGFLIVQNMFILLALWSRVEPVMLAFMLTVPLSLLVLFARKKQWLKTLVIALGPAVMMAVLTSVLLNIPFNEEDRHYAGLRTYQFVLWDFERPESELNIESPRDSMIYLAARKSYFGDKENITPEFFERIGLRKMDKSISDIPNYFSDFGYNLTKLGPFLDKYVFGFFWLTLAFFISIIFGFITLKSDWRMSGIRYMILQFVFLAVVLALAVFMKMEARIFVPMLSLAVLMNIYLISHLTVREEKSEARNSKYQLVILAALASFAIIFIFSETSKIGSRAASQAYTDFLTAESEERFSGKTMVYDLWAIDAMFGKLLRSHQLSEKLNYLSFDNGLIFLHDEYERHMNKTCGGADLRSIFRSFLARKKQIVFLGDPYRMDLMQAYLHHVHGVDVQFELIADNFNEKFLNDFSGIKPMHELHYYSLK